MPASIALSHFLFAMFIAGVSATLLVAILVAIFFRDVVIEEYSTATSEHKFSSLELGGLAVIGAYIVGISTIQWLGQNTPIQEGYFWGYLASLLVISALSTYATVKPTKIKVFLVGQIVAISILMLAGIVIKEFHLPWVGWVVGGWWSYPLTLLWVLGLTRAYRHMDGPEGVAVNAAVIASGFFSFVCFQYQSIFIYLCSLVLFSAALGFFAFNRLLGTAAIGSIGSTFLGFSFAVMAIIAGLYDYSHTSMLVVPLLLFHCIFDVAFTHIRRLWDSSAASGRKTAFLYQLLGQAGYSSRSMTLIYTVMAVTQGLGAIMLVNIQGSSRIAVFLPFILAQTIYAVWVIALPKPRES